jgi:hypothetical protein
MGNGDHGLAAHDALQGTLDHRLDLGIERTGGLVRSSIGASRASPARARCAGAVTRQLDPALAHMRVIARAGRVHPPGGR